MAASYNALCIAAELGIDRVVMASSVNSIGMSESKRFSVAYAKFGLRGLDSTIFL